MLILTRRHQESVVIQGIADPGHTLKVTVLQIRGGNVRLGFEAPGEVVVHRVELLERVRTEAVDGERFNRRVNAT